MEYRVRPLSPLDGHINNAFVTAHRRPAARGEKSASGIDRRPDPATVDRPKPEESTPAAGKRSTSNDRSAAGRIG